MSAWPVHFPKPPKEYRIALRPDHEGLLDDVVVNDVEMFRMERMDDDQWWACCYLRGTDEMVTFHFGSRKGRRKATDVYVTDYPNGVAYEPGSMGTTASRFEGVAK